MKQTRFAALLSLLIIIFLLHTALHAQLSAPDAESVYGGRINAITGIAVNPETSRIFIATESANSLFYADVAVNATPPVFGTFEVMPGINAAAGYGSGIRQIAAHDSSGMLFFLHNDGLLSSHPTSSAVSTIQAGHFSGLLIHDSSIFFATGGFLYFGTLDTSGAFTNGVGAPLSAPAFGGQMTLCVNPQDSTIFVFREDVTPALYQSSVPHDQIDGSTTFTDISPASLSASVQWRAFGIAPDGRLFIAGSDNTGKQIAYSDDGITWNSYAVGIQGVAGANLAFGGDSTSYHVYFASVYNSNNGLAGSWESFGNPGGWQTHPNDGAVYADPVNPAIVYMTTDQGIGASLDYGSTIFEIDDGVEAVQVHGFDMSADKNIGWVASKSGIRKVTNYLSTPLWTNAIFPNTDGSPYYSVSMNPQDTSSVYVSNVRVYKTHDDGTHWQQVFSPEHAPYSFSSFGTRALAIEVCDYDTNIVFAGYEIQGTDHGGLFYSMDGGQTWDQLLVEAASIGQDVDVFDVVFNLEGADTVAYVGVEYDLDSPQGRSVYKITRAGDAWNVTQDMAAGRTSTGSLIVATIRDLEVSTTGDTVFAAGTDAGVNHPIAYYKPLNTTGVWTPFTTSGFPTGGTEATAITIGRDTVYCAVDNEIYLYPVSSSSSWTLGYAYPVGQRINFLYFDDLLVGTETGLYGHLGAGGVTDVSTPTIVTPEAFTLRQNYPNPFNPGTTIAYELPAEANVTIRVYNIRGEHIVTLAEGVKRAGAHTIEFNGSSLPSGLYFYTVDVGHLRQTKRMLLLK